MNSFIYDINSYIYEWSELEIYTFLICFSITVTNSITCVLGVIFINWLVFLLIMAIFSGFIACLICLNGHLIVHVYFCIPLNSVRLRYWTLLCCLKIVWYLPIFLLSFLRQDHTAFSPGLILTRDWGQSLLSRRLKSLRITRLSTLRGNGNYTCLCEHWRLPPSVDFR